MMTYEREKYIDALLECIRELATNRLNVARDAGVKPGDIGPGRAEHDARKLVAPYLQLSENELDNFLKGKLGPESVKLRVIGGGME